MIKKISNIFYLISFFIFVFLITKYYFSDQNIKIINKSRSSYSFESNQESYSLPLLTNDTSEIIIYQNGIEEFNEACKNQDNGKIKILLDKYIDGYSMNAKEN